MYALFSEYVYNLICLNIIYLTPKKVPRSKVNWDFNEIVESDKYEMTLWVLKYQIFKNHGIGSHNIQTWKLCLHMSASTHDFFMTICFAYISKKFKITTKQKVFNSCFWN